MTREELIAKYRMDEDWGIVLKDGTVINGLFVCVRVADEDVPDGMFKYDLREDDCLDCPATIEKRVLVNHYGTFITDEPIDFGGKDYLELDTSEYEPNLYMWPYGYSDIELLGRTIVTWPDSQDLMEVKGFYDNAYLINDEEGLEKYGSSAYVVDKYWLTSTLGTTYEDTLT